MDSQINIYQLSGLDDRERGFTRQVEISYRDKWYQAVLRYERFRADGSSPTDETGALRNLIHTLQAQGYTQLRSQLIFRGQLYLGSQELWVDYGDEEIAKKQRDGIWGLFFKWVKKRLNHRTSHRNHSRC